MSTSTLNISLPETLKRFVKERTKTANYSNPSDYVRSLIRDDQRRMAAEKLWEQMLAKHVSIHPATSPANIEKLRTEFWLRWHQLKAEIDKGLGSLESSGGRAFDRALAEGVKVRGRQRLARAKAV